MGIELNRYPNVCVCERIFFNSAGAGGSDRTTGGYSGGLHSGRAEGNN